MIPADIAVKVIRPPMRCAECNCKRGGSACTWIKAGDELTHEEYIDAALDLDAVMALVVAATNITGTWYRHGGISSGQMDDVRTALAAFTPNTEPKL